MEFEKIQKEHKIKRERVFDDEKDNCSFIWRAVF